MSNKGHFIFLITCAFLMSFSTTTRAKVNRSVLDMLDQPLTKVILAYPGQEKQSDHRTITLLDTEAEDIILGLKEKIPSQQDLTLRELLSLPRPLVLPKLNPYHHEDWQINLWKWLYTQGLSFEMSDTALKLASEDPNSLLFATLREAKLGSKMGSQLGSQGVYTVYEWFARFPSQTSFDEYVDSLLVDEDLVEPGVGPIALQQLKMKYDEINLQLRDKGHNSLDKILFQTALKKRPAIRDVIAEKFSSTDDLLKLSNEAMWELSGKDPEVLVELYLFMKELGVYHSPLRPQCSSVL